MINNKTELFISVSLEPGNTGAYIHNTLYTKFDLNCIYKPMKVFSSHNVEPIINAIKTLDIRGCSVAAPFKILCVPHLDVLHGPAKKLGSVNTITNHQGFLQGYNTDYFGLDLILTKIHTEQSLKTAIIIGNGAMSRICKDIFERLNISITTFARHPNYHQGDKDLKTLNTTQFSDILINCTSSSTVLSIEDCPPANVYMDVLTIPTNLTTVALQKHKQYISGKTLAIYQSLKQFEIYTENTLNIEEEFNNYASLLIS